MKKKTRKLLSKLFGVLSIVFGAIAVLLVLAGIVGIFLSEPTFWQGWAKFADTFSPFNILNYILIFLFFSPAFICWKLKDWLSSPVESPFQKKFRELAEQSVNNLKAGSMLDHIKNVEAGISPVDDDYYKALKLDNKRKK